MGPGFRLLLAVILIALIGSVSVVQAGPNPVEPEDQLLIQIWLPDPVKDVVVMAEGPLLPLAHEPGEPSYLLARMSPGDIDWLKGSGYSFEVIDRDAAGASYCMEDMRAPGRVVLEAAREVLRTDDRVLWRLPAETGPSDCTGWAWMLHPIRLIPRRAPEIPSDIGPLPFVQDILGMIDLPHMMAYAEELSGAAPAIIYGDPYTITTRYTTSGVPIAKAIDYMIERLERLDLPVSTHTWDVTKPPNIIAEKAGRSQEAGIYIICAHLDSRARGYPHDPAPGADDNGSGSVAVLAAAEVLAPYTFDATIRFILFTGEEQGLYGSRAYANMVQDEDIRAVLNMDMIAWDSVGGPEMDLHARDTVPGSLDMATLFADVVSAYGLNLTPQIIPNGVPASDHSPFWDEGFPAILAIEDYFGTGDFNAYYHTVNDKTIYYNQAFFDQMVKGSIATFGHLVGPPVASYWADLSYDGKVTVEDIMMTSRRWGAEMGQWNYHVVYDIDRNGVVDAVDIQLIATEWGWTENP
ncbi:MAG: M20/M25/M40 family metallo-hydrolase [Chloroflexota bacterium]|nr:M20/M25/M40 family metallo-hydrolase [Chloroflexota bacterium]